jgi:hypothetical protein
MSETQSGQEAVQLNYNGRPLDMSAARWGTLRCSNDAVADRPELERRLAEDGYIYLPGLLCRDEVIEARAEVCRRLEKAGILAEGTDPLEGVVKADISLNGAATGPFMPQLVAENRPLHRLLYDGAMMRFYAFLFGGEVRHYDYTWFRAKLPGAGQATTPHCDIVYMGRGTRRLLTSWTPLGDVPYEMGGLMVLEGSHRLEATVSTYGQTDVDRYCANEGDAEALVGAAQAQGRELSAEERQQLRWNSTGWYGQDAIEVGEELGGRWLTAEYAVGDLLIFCMDLMHASTDNQTNRIRLSTDTRYQLASEPVDERWIGDDPPAHGIRAKRGMVC